MTPGHGLPQPRPAFHAVALETPSLKDTVEKRRPLHASSVLRTLSRAPTRE